MSGESTGAGLDEFLAVAAGRKATIKVLGKQLRVRELSAMEFERYSEIAAQNKHEALAYLFEQCILIPKMTPEAAKQLCETAPPRVIAELMQQLMRHMGIDISDTQEGEGSKNA